MPKVIYFEPGGRRREVDVEVGRSVMEGAVANLVDGITADCGGSCICGTCHVHVDSEWFEKTGDRNEDELDLLETVEQFGDRSRLGCQLTVTDELDGLVVRIPKPQ